MKPRHNNGGLRKVCGCPRRTWAKCPHSWYFNFKPRGGASYRFSLDKHFNRHVDSKSEAEDLAADLRKAIRAGRFGQPTPIADMTLHQLIDNIHHAIRRSRASDHRARVSWGLNTIGKRVLPRPTGGHAPFGEWKIADIVTDSILRFREVRRGQGAGIVGTNRHLGTLRAMFNWAIGAGSVESSPFLRGTKAVVTIAKEPSRSRRRDAGEEQQLLAHCRAHLHAVVAAAIETGMRRGEILSLQWAQIEGLKVNGRTVSWAPKSEIVLLAEKTKSQTHRRIPISTRLRAILEMRCIDPAGQPMPGDAFVFGTQIGTRLLGVAWAWHTAVLKSHGQKPAHTTTGNLTPESRNALKTIDLHFHDLRREAGSRWLDGGVPLHTIRDWLGHTNISQTSTYLAGTATTQHDAMTRFEAHQAVLQRLATDAETRGAKEGTVGRRAGHKAQHNRGWTRFCHHVNSVRDREVAGSNPVAPTTFSEGPGYTGPFACTA